MPKSASALRQTLCLRPAIAGTPWQLQAKLAAIANRTRKTDRMSTQ